MVLISTSRLARRFAAAALATLALPTIAAAQTFDFDGVGPTFTYVGATYSPFVFGGVAQVVQDGGGYGVLSCATSGAFCLYNGSAAQDVTLSRSDAATFSLVSANFTSWFGSTSATVVGTLGGATVFSQTFALGASAASQTFANVAVDQVQFLANAGASAGYFLADDVVVGAAPSVPSTTTPEPVTLALVAGGLGAVGLVRRRTA